MFISKDWYFLWTSPCFVFLFCNGVFFSTPYWAFPQSAEWLRTDWSDIMRACQKTQVIGYTGGTSRAPQRVLQQVCFSSLSLSQSLLSSKLYFFSDNSLLKNIFTFSLNFWIEKWPFVQQLCSLHQKLTVTKVVRWKPYNLPSFRLEQLNIGGSSS